MDLGLFMMPLHNPGRNYTEVLAEDREMILLADKLGYQEVWVGEHHTASPEPIADALQFLASVVGETKSIKFATGVLNVPQHHPGRLAGNVAQFDHLAKGRFIMGVGPGGLATDFELFGALEGNRQEMMIDAVEIIHKIWASDPPYHIKGKYWSVDVARHCNPALGWGPMLKPYQQPFPPLAVSAMSVNSSTARLAGRQGWGIVSANFTTIANARTHWTQYCNGAAEAGRIPNPADWRIARSILVTETDEEARDYLADPLSSYHWYYSYIRADMASFNMLNNLKPDLTIPDADVTVEKCLDWMVIAGKPATVLDQLIAMSDETGPFGTLLTTQKDWDKPALHKNSLFLLADSVMPKFRQHLMTLKAAE